MDAIQDETEHCKRGVHRRTVSAERKFRGVKRAVKNQLLLAFSSTGTEVACNNAEVRHMHKSYIA
jgi:hypothetical protein